MTINFVVEALLTPTGSLNSPDSSSWIERGIVVFNSTLLYMSLSSQISTANIYTLKHTMNRIINPRSGCTVKASSLDAQVKPTIVVRCSVHIISMLWFYHYREQEKNKGTMSKSKSDVV